MIAVVVAAGCDGKDGALDGGEADQATSPIHDATEGPVGDTGVTVQSGGGATGKVPGVEEGWVLYACCRWGCDADVQADLYKDFAIPASASGAIGPACECGRIGWQGCDTDPCDPNDTSTGSVCMFGVIAPADGGAWSDEPSPVCPYRTAAYCEALVRCVEKSGIWERLLEAGVGAPSCGDGSDAGRADAGS